jgi:DNA-binding CsgD family transcriptional regulator
MIEITRPSIAAAADKMLEAALLGDGWQAALAGFAQAAGARGAVLVGELASREDPWAWTKVKMTIVPTPSIARHIAEYLAGRIPPDPRIGRVRPSRSGGFLADFGSFSPDEIARDPYYMEYLRPIGLGWHACAFLADWSSHDSLYLNLKRRFRDGHYEPRDILTIDSALPALRAAVKIAHMRLDAQTVGYAQGLGAGGEAIFELNALGCAIRTNEAAVRLLGDDLVLEHGCLTARQADNRHRLDRAIGAALARPPSIGFAVLATSDAGRRLVVRAVPIPGVARAAFGAATALVVVDTWRQPRAPSPQFVRALRQAFGLTRMEAQVAALVAAGVSPMQAARLLAIAEGTARNHLKSAMAKTGVSRQAGLAALTAQLAR